MSHSRTVFRSYPHCADKGTEAPEGGTTALQATLLVGGRASVQTQGLFSNAARSAPSVNGGCLVRPHSGSVAGSSLELGIPALSLSQSPHSPIQLPESYESQRKGNLNVHVRHLAAKALSVFPV